MSKTRREVNDYYHGPVDIGYGNSADYVVAHGKRQLQRSKNPSTPYFNIDHNPLDPKSKPLLFGWKAFEAAQIDLLERARRRGEDEADFIGKVILIHSEGDKIGIAASTVVAMENMVCNGAVGARLFQPDIDVFLHCDFPGTTQVLNLSIPELSLTGSAAEA